MSYETFVTRLRAARVRARLSHAELAARLGVTRGAIGNYESLERRPPIDVAERWAEACGHRLVIEVVPIDGFDAGPLSDYERRLVHAVRELPEDAHRELVLSLARALPGHDVARESVVRQVDLLASLSPPAAAGLVAALEG